VLAHAGVGSRRACEEVILQGRVTVDGQVVRELGTKVDSRSAKIAVDGQPIHLERMVYFAVSKPKGYVSTNNDPSGRPRVVDLLPELPQRVYTVGRLDEMSTGLILLTNDGELANRLTHPKFGIEKLYRVVVAGTPEREVLDKLTEGVWLAEGKVRARRVRVVGKRGQATILEMVLAEGKNREVRRMLAKLGHKVMTLTRIAVGPITLKGLALGEYRPLSRDEVELLRKVAAGLLPGTAGSPSRRSRATERRPKPTAPAEAERGPARRPPHPQRHAAAEGPPSRERGPRRSSGPPSPAPRPSPRGRASGERRLVSEADAPAARRPGPRPPLPEGLPPSQRRPPRPSGPPPSQRRAGPGAAGGRPPRPVRPPADEPPTRRIIGLDTGPARERPAPGRPRRPPAKRKFPRSALGPRRPAPHDEGEK
jgi:23S rRNA pseudouridine2605 synthase